ncbi:MAG: methionyl-tRNA formyltransferase [Clostridia bacterium]|nr:methionyl-tRNA formyltransferase [Clostridia bacterium]
MGTPEYALFALKALVAAGEQIVGVVTQPDKPKGRGYELCPPPVKVYAMEQGLPVYQPATLKNGAFDEELKALAPDLIVVVAYGKILPQTVLDFPKFGCINVHGSILPEYRGAAPMQRAIIDGKTETGVTTMQMAAGLDTGDMLVKVKVPIGENDNFEDIHDRLGVAGAEALTETLARLRAGTLTAIPQDDTLATYAAKIEKADCLLDFSKDARTLHNLIRGLSPFPLAFTCTPDGKMLKVPESRVGEKKAPDGAASGTVLALDNTITVACGNGTTLEILRVLPEGKGRMSAADYIRGRRLSVGDMLG